MKLKIFSIIIVIALAGTMFWIVPIFQKRYFQQDKESGETVGTAESPFLGDPETKEDIQREDASEEMENNKQEAGSGTEEMEKVQIDISHLNPEDNGDSFTNITSEHCNSSCRAFENDFEHLEYCEQVCNISPLKNVSRSDCEEKNGLEKDYCLKQWAISQKDFSACKQIEDANILRTCQNTITQNIIEGN